MLRDRKPTYKELTRLITERSQESLRKFGQTLIKGTNNAELLCILQDVTSYWKDRLRPALASLCCEAVGGQPNSTEDIGLMITLIAAGMGIHDDIIDKTSTKHFRMTVLKHHNEDEALVVGDLLIVKALTAIREIARRICSPKKTEEIIQVYESAFIEMCEGEFMEISCRKNLDVDLKYYQEVLWKFASDIEVCSRLGAIMGDGSTREVLALSEFGRRYGFLSRLASDMKDSLNFEGNLPQRLQNESIPLPILIAAKSSKPAYSKIDLILKKPSFTPPDLEILLNLCFEVDAFAQVFEVGKENFSEANINLHLIEPSFARNTLEQMLKNGLAEMKKFCQ
jgi:geranylgeranyl pyrophosphate synthase